MDPVMSTHTTHAPQEAVAKATHVPHRWRNLVTLTGVTVVDNTEAGLTSTLFPSISKALGLDSGHLGILAGDRQDRRRSGRSLLGVAVEPDRPARSPDGHHVHRWHLRDRGGLLDQLRDAAPVQHPARSVHHRRRADRERSDRGLLREDHQRGKAAGYYYGIITLISSFIGPLLALFTGNINGWRYGIATIGVICLLATTAVALFFKDPGVGASEKQLADLPDEERVRTPVNVRTVLSLFRIPSFSVMMLSRLLSGHLLISIFGIQFLVTERGFNNKVAASVLIPFGIGYFIATVAGGWIVAGLDRVWPDRGRVAYLQAAQVFFALVAFFGTQFHYGSIGTYAIFWALFGVGQGINPPVNRPVVAAIVLPELRGQAFAIWLTIFETIGWALFSLLAGQLARTFGIQEVFFAILVVLMLVNALVLTVLYATYPRDVARVEDELERRRIQAVGAR
jgi:MFS family permease